MSSKLLPVGILAIVGLITIKVVMFFVAGTIAIFALLFKLLPIVLIAWLVWRLVKYVAGPKTAET